MQEIYWRLTYRFIDPFAHINRDAWHAGGDRPTPFRAVLTMNMSAQHPHNLKMAAHHRRQILRFLPVPVSAHVTLPGDIKRRMMKKKDSWLVRSAGKCLSQPVQPLCAAPTLTFSRIDGVEGDQSKGIIIYYVV